MAIGDSYASPAEYAAAKKKLSSEDEAAIARDLTGISRYIDRVCGRVAGFNKDAAAVQRVYIPKRNTVELLVADLVSVSAITADTAMNGQYGETLSAADYELHPLDAADGPEPWPYTSILATPWGARAAWQRGVRVKVNGIWGWPSVPAAIAAATIELTAILRLESPRATNSITELNQVLGTSRVAQSILGEIVNSYGRTGEAVAW